ncbi:MAG: zinc ribbon domain-containing protein [Chthonomonadales bacterium]|nr:zinc ribbon domain-containing protein [Chthonomonadales bacterium]
MIPSYPQEDHSEQTIGLHLRYNLSMQRLASITESDAVREYAARLRDALSDVPPDEAEALMNRGMAEVELEAEIRYVDPNDAASVRAMLARLGSPVEMARRLRSSANATSEPTASLTSCRSCKREVSTDAVACPHCGAPFPGRRQWTGWGYEYRSRAQIRGWPLVHIAFGRDQNGKRRVARGVIAIGQFGVGAITIAQFGVGLVFGFGQFVVAPLAIGQFALGLLAAGQFGIGVLAGAGQIATGLFAAGMKAFGVWTRSSF